MSMPKPRAAPTDEELLKTLEDIPDDAPGGQHEPKTSARAGPARSEAAPRSEQDLLAELDNLIEERPVSRSQTPKPQPSMVQEPVGPPKRGQSASPASVDARKHVTSATGAEQEPKEAAEASVSQTVRAASPSRRQEHSGDAKTRDEPVASKPSSPPGARPTGQGWWGGLVATASAAVKTAEAAVKEIQQNEEAKRWTEQVKGNVGALKGLGQEISSRALPTFTNLLHTLAPPISAHERLQIHITHDMVGYPSLDPLIYQTFSRVMAQVEGGDLLVVQRGQESAPKSSTETGTAFAGSGWADGPWWRHAADQRNLGVVKGPVEATKLARASAKSYATEFYAPMGGVEEASNKATAAMSESNPVRNSHIFLAIQAMGVTHAQDWFGGTRQDGGDEHDTAAADDDTSNDLVAFAMSLHDPEHGIGFDTVTQSFPQKWVDWMDAAPRHTASSPGPGSPTGGRAETLLRRVSHDIAGADPGSRPEEIAEIMKEGGADPREWVAEWLEETLSLGVGIIAQRYVARRMGVGEGGIGRGKARQQTLDSGGGEAARAI